MTGSRWCVLIVKQDAARQFRIGYDKFGLIWNYPPAIKCNGPARINSSFQCKGDNCLLILGVDCSWQ
jgi:hypothetical protein